MDTQAATPTQLRLHQEAQARREKFFKPEPKPQPLIALVPQTSDPSRDVMDIVISAVGNVAGVTGPEILAGPPTRQIISARNLAMAMCVRRGIPVLVVANYFEIDPAPIKDALEILDPILREHSISRRQPLELILPLIFQGWSSCLGERNITIDMIKEAVSRVYGISREDLIGHRRVASLMEPRHMAMALCTKLTKFSLPYIAKRFDGRDHTTILHARDKMKPILSKLDAIMPVDATATQWVLAFREQLQCTSVDEYWK